jgi:hypothetical protein
MRFPAFQTTRALFAATVLASTLGLVADRAAAQSVVAVVAHRFEVAMPIDTVLQRLRQAVARCWSDDYDSRALGRYREAAEIPSAASGGRASVRLEWVRVVNDKSGPMLKRAFDINLAQDGAVTHVTVLAYGPRTDVGRDIEAWVQGRERCFAERYPSP